MTANVALTDTFDQWRVKTNELIVGTQADGMANIIKTTDTTNSTSNTTGSIITAGGIGVTKSAHIGGNLKVWGDVTTVGDTTISGNLTFGDASTDQVTFSADINSNMIPNANLTFNVGNTLNQWANTYTGHLAVTQKTDSGKSAVTVTSTDVDQIGISVVASQTTADVLDIAADAVTTAKVIDITADALTTGSALYIDDNSAITGVGGTRNTVDILQNNAAALAATALKVQSDGGITGITLDKNYTDVAAATVTGLHVDFDRTVPGSGTATFTDIGINLDVNAAGLGTTTTTGLDIDVVGATTGTHTAVGLDVAVGSADTNYALITSGGNVGIGVAAPASVLHVAGTVQVGVDDTGHDVKFFGATTGQYMLWDESADELALTLDSKLSFWDAAGGENIVASSDGHLEVNAGTTLDITAPTVDINASTGITLDGSILSTVTVGVNDAGHDVTFYGDAAGALAMWDTSADSLLVRGATADAAGSTGRIVLQTAQVGVADGDILGRVYFQAPLETQGGDGALVSASIWAEADATFTATVNNTELVFATATNDAVVERMRLDSGGQLGIGTATPAYGLDVQGTVGITGATTQIGAVTVGVDDAGHDVKFFGATTGQYMLWDESADELALTLDSKLSFWAAAGGENIAATSDGALGINAGTTLTLTAPTITVADGSVDFDIASHDGTNGLKLGGTLVTSTAAQLNGAATTGKAIAMAIVFG